MSKLPLLSWREVVKALTSAGFQVARQKGSHLILIKNEHVVPVPKHKKRIIDGDHVRGRFDKRRISRAPKIRLILS